jgi:CRP/FNR family transcriptional regulator, cyclic AMP receptor protein
MTGCEGTNIAREGNVLPGQYPQMLHDNVAKSEDDRNADQYSEIMPAIHTDRRLLIDLLTPDAHEQLFIGSRRMSFERGEVILPSKRIPEYIYFLESGQVHVSDVGSDGRLHAFKIVGRRSFIMLTDLFAEGRMSFEVRALTACSARQIKLSRLQELAMRRLDVAAPLVKIMQSLALEAYSMASERSILSAECRLARTILRLVVSHGQPHPEGIAINTKLTQSQIAHVAGTTRQMASTWITHAQRKGLLVLETKTLIVKDLPALEKLAMSTETKT